MDGQGGSNIEWNITPVMGEHESSHKIIAPPMRI